MFIECFKNNGIDYLRLVESNRVINKNGIKTSSKKVIYNIGSLKNFDDNKPNYLERLKESFKNGKPLIESLQQFCSDDLPQQNYKFTFTEGVNECIGHPKLFSQILIEKLLEIIGITSFVHRYKELTNYKFDILGFIRLLIYGRVLNPSSKIATTAQNLDYYNPPLDNPYPFNVYDTLDFIYRFKGSIVKTINKNVKKHFKRNTTIIYYDVTNFFFEIEKPDEDIFTDNTEIKGLRKKGVSKEERTLPIVQMGLFMDETGLPISIEIFPGNTLDHQTMVKACKGSIDNLDLTKFIFVADKGILATSNLLHLINHNNGYIISKSVRKCNKADKEWVLDKNGYKIISSDFKYKSRIIKYKAQDPNNKNSSVNITEKQVVYWSKKYYDKEYHDNKSFLEFLEKLKKSPENFRITSTQAKSLKRFLKDKVVDIKTGEVLETKNIKTMIDYNKVNQYIDSMGYYILVTSETKMDDKKIINTYHKLSRIEDEFRIMKSSLEARPIYLRNEEHIFSHLFICMISLLIIRIIQLQIVKYKNKKSKSKNLNLWEMGLSSDRIIKALNKWTIDKFPDDYYRFNNIDDEDLKLILDAFSINIECKLYRREELREIKSNINFLT